MTFGAGVKGQDGTMRHATSRDGYFPSFARQCASLAVQLHIVSLRRQTSMGTARSYGTLRLMSMVHILLVEDDARLAHLTAEYLGNNEFAVQIENRGDKAEARILAEQPDVVILDIMLPGRDGFELCRSIRPLYSGIIMMFTARDEDFDQILGLELGADDYITKTVPPRVLLARIKTLLRRQQGSARPDKKELAFGNFHISQATRTARAGEEELDLTTAEFDLLWLLASHAGSILSRDELLHALRGIGFDGLDRSIDARISRLRKKIGDDSDNPTRIKTVRGKGYLFSRHEWL
jgi:two-component system OmpR family response regulator/two-component system response regulator RstA